MSPRSHLFLAGATSIAVAACIGWEGQSGKSALSPPGIALQDPQPGCRSMVRGTLWPPPDEPTFVVARRRITIERGDGRAEVETDQRGRFEVRTEMSGRYAATFSSETHHATAHVTVAACSTYVVDLVVRRM
jgi:hypothetical protein